LIEPWLKKLSNSAIADLEVSLKHSFGKVKEELDEHLEAINNNTNEIQTNFEYLTELESKVTKLNEKVERILEILEGKKDEPTYHVEELTLREQEVFITLYSATKPVTYTQISHKIALPADMIRQLIQSLLTL
jgi:predicted nuclease with TOPRIM domain